jgi:hypothetical protein
MVAVVTAGDDSLAQVMVGVVILELYTQLIVEVG